MRWIAVAVVLSVAAGCGGDADCGPGSPDFCPVDPAAYVTAQNVPCLCARCGPVSGAFTGVASPENLAAFCDSLCR